ncbi:hypothetical protein CPB85DRAFT_1250950 [Mucidula mucida]|nr:hypothetical protein CPB85DRAFT_1250950 [Mucidula mucida]
MQFKLITLTTLALATFAAATPTPAPRADGDGQCATGTLQCCNTTTPPRTRSSASSSRSWASSSRTLTPSSASTAPRSASSALEAANVRKWLSSLCSSKSSIAKWMVQDDVAEPMLEKVSAHTAHSELSIKAKAYLIYLQTLLVVVHPSPVLVDHEPSTLRVRQLHDREPGNPDPPKREELPDHPIFQL